jgi:hypothetical protein
MVEIKTNPRFPSSMADRAARRLRPSNDTEHADWEKKQGDSPLRTNTTGHHTRNTDYGEPAPESPGIDGKKRGVV